MYMNRVQRLKNLMSVLWLVFYEVYTLSEAWSGVNWADLMAAQGAFGTDFYDSSTRAILEHDALHGV